MEKFGDNVVLRLLYGLSAKLESTLPQCPRLYHNAQYRIHIPSWTNRSLDKYELGPNTYSSLLLCLGQKSFNISKGPIAFPNQQWMKVEPRFDYANTRVWVGGCGLIVCFTHSSIRPSKGPSLASSVRDDFEEQSRECGRRCRPAGCPGQQSRGAAAPGPRAPSPRFSPRQTERAN